jgi:hypothetical protein
VNDKQYQAVIAELREQREIMCNRCMDYVSRSVMLQEMIDAKDKRLAELEDEVKRMNTPQEIPAPPPVDNEHVAPGCENFDQPGHPNGPVARLLDANG